jgi:Protein of unknown function (DUF3995)
VTAAGVAAALAFASAAVSLYWTAGGTWLLDTVGGSIEELARERSTGAVAAGVVVVLAKVAVGLLALRLDRHWRRVLAALAAGVLVVWGGANVVFGALALAGAVGQVDDEHALRWHVFLWDPWFLVWGIALALATARARTRA